MLPRCYPRGEINCSSVYENRLKIVDRRWGVGITHQEWVIVAKPGGLGSVPRTHGER